MVKCMDKEKILIIGGVAGGASAAARLRRLKEQAEIILFERGDYISFANCGLPYYIGGEIREESALTLQTPESFYGRFRVDVRIRHEVISIDRAAKRVQVLNLADGSEYSESYDKLILSPGAEPIKPPIQGLDTPSVFTVRNIPDTIRIQHFIQNHKPRKAAVIGGGYIGVEMAENLKTAGLDVTLVEMQDQVIAPLDYDMACLVHRHMREKGVELLLQTAVKSAEALLDREGVRLLLSSHAGESAGSIDADLVILAIGVKPDSRLAAEAGLAVGVKGSIEVNDQLLTSDPHIYAVGDAIQVKDFITGEKTNIPLAGPANKQGRLAADQICGIPGSYTGTQGSSILKVFDLTVATTGLSEKAAKKAGLSYEKLFTSSASHATYYPGAQNIRMKTLFDPDTGKILGAQLIGREGVDKRCDVLATAIRFHAGACDLARLELCYAPPYSSAKDPVNMAGFAIENILAGKVSQFHWHDVAALPRDGSVTLLDTRTEMEYSAGHMEGFRNIPLNSLRDQISQLDQSKPVYVTCQIGLRGYLACRILTQNGFTCYNLSGGYELYQSVLG